MALIAIAMACLAVGCTGPPALEGPAPPPFAIHFEKSGGLKPVREELTIGPDRHAVAAMATLTKAGTRTVHFRVSRKKVTILRRGLGQARFSELQSPPTGNCADCFLYTIEYRDHEVTIDDSALPAKLREVVTELEAIVFTHVVRPPPGQLP